MIIFTLTTSRGGRPATFTSVSDLLKALERELRCWADDTGEAKTIIGVKRVQDQERGQSD